MRHVRPVLVVPVMVLALLVGGSAAAVAAPGNGSTARSHPPTCC